MFFGASLGKILVLAAIMLVVWYGFRLAARKGRTPLRTRRQRGETPSVTATLRPCQRCGTYLPDGTGCERADCPRA